MISAVLCYIPNTSSLFIFCKKIAIKILWIGLQNTITFPLNSLIKFFVNMNKRMCDRVKGREKLPRFPVPVSSIKTLVYNLSLKNETTFNLRVKMSKDLYHTTKDFIYIFNQLFISFGKWERKTASTLQSP